MGRELSRRQILQLAAGMAAALPARGAAQLRPEPYPRLLQGPMVGPPGPDHLIVWARASGEFEVQLEYDRHWPFRASRRSAVAHARKSDDYIVVLRAGDLEPDTRYHYRVLVDGAPDRNIGPLGAFETRTAPAVRRGFRVLFGSCARVEVFPNQPIWSAVAAARPDLFLWLGDNIYADALDPDIFAESYKRQRQVPEWLPVMRSTPQLAIWDDHDFGTNDSDARNPVREESLAVFRRFWPNPSYGRGGVPGVFFHYEYAGVDFFFLDTRYHRDPAEAPDGEGKSVLGLAQRKWLLDGLAGSRAPFKVLVSGTGWTQAKGPGADSWASFQHELTAVLSFIRDREVGGVLLLSGDTHVGELNAIPWSEQGAYDFYDIVSSPLAQIMHTNWSERRPEMRIRPVYAPMPNVGVLDFTFDGVPAVTISMLNEVGHSVWEPLRLTTEDLRNGVRSWDRMMDPGERRRYERWKAGRGYYEPVR